jgi:hypothetical protein
MINLVKLTSALVLKVQSGTDTDGNTLYRNITLKKVKPAAVEQDLFDVATAISALLENPVEGIFRQNLDEMISSL